MVLLIILATIFLCLKFNNQQVKQELMVQKNVAIMVPLKQLSSFWRFLGMSLVNCEINLLLIWSANYVIYSADANQV